MIVKREEPNTLQVSSDGSITLPAGFILWLLKETNGEDNKGLEEDLADFGYGRFVVVRTSNAETGTMITIERDRRPELPASEDED